MGSARSADTQRRAFRVAAPILVSIVVLVGILLSPGMPLATREAASSGGFLLAGLATVLCASWRAMQTTGRRRSSWLLFTSAAVTAMTSNLWAAIGGKDPIDNPSLVADVGITLALLLTIVGLAIFPSVPRRGNDLALLVLDGVVTGSCALAMVTVVVYPDLLESSATVGLAHLASLVFPVLDVILATMAGLLVLRASKPDRPSLLLISSGFVTYAVTDLAFAVLVAKGQFAYGTWVDLGWIVGYMLVSLAAVYPSSLVDEPTLPQRDVSANSRGAVLMFGSILAGATVQVLLGEKLAGSRALVWLVIALAGGSRLGLVTWDNASLRRGLERRVQEQTDDLRRLARENEVLLESVGDGIYGVDRDGLITFVNPSAARALGRSTDELLGANAHHEFHDDHAGQDDEAPGACYVSAAIETGRMISGVEDVYGRGAAAFPVEITASPMVDRDRPRGAVVVFRDITQRHEVDRMKNEFLSVVSHELRTPLTSIRGSLGLLAGGAVGELDPRASKMVGVAVESSERLTRLINDLLDIERIDSGSRAMRPGIIDASTLVEAAVHQIQGLATPLAVVVRQGTCSGRVLADEDQIMQTLINLLGNAIKFSEADGVVTADAAQDDGFVTFRVRDQGRGIPASKLETVFEPFAQVDSSDSRQKGGTGLGLSISRSIVTRHGGRIWAESVYGEGTTVLFTLPAAP